MASPPLFSLRAQARAAAQNAHAPFSGRGAAAALLLSDGAWVPGVRVESASFSLTMAPALNAFTTAVAAGRRDVVAAAFSRPVHPVERAFLEQIAGPLRTAGDDACAADGATLPPLGDRLDPFLPDEPPATPRAGVALARTQAERALVPSSQFPVGCVLAVDDALVPGVNVEPPSGAPDGEPDDEAASENAPSDWSHVLCAERSALGTACTYGVLGEAERRGKPEADEEAPKTALYLSCPKDAAGSPCGACRQLLVELLPRGVLWMARGVNTPERARPSDLLPGSFQGTALSRSAPSA